MVDYTGDEMKNCAFDDVVYFLPVEDGRINLQSFLKSSSGLLSIIDRFGKIFKPVKNDMQGNIDKIQKYLVYDNESCLIELMLEEKAAGKSNATDATLWLNRALLFFELVFQEILNDLEIKNHDINMKRIFTCAYEGSVKKYHNWAIQQLFSVICKMSPTFTQISNSFGIENDLEAFEARLSKFHLTLHQVRSEIDNYFSRQ